MITLEILPFISPTVFIVRKTEEIESTYLFFFKKKRKEYTDLAVGTYQQVHGYIKENNVIIDQSKTW